MTDDGQTFLAQWSTAEQSGVHLSFVAGTAGAPPLPGAAPNGR